MQNQYKLLNSLLDEAQKLNEKGDTASASSIIQMVSGECLVMVAEKLAEIEKRLGELIASHSHSTNPEKLANKQKGS